MSLPALNAQAWLFGPRTDLGIFAGSAALSAAFVASGPALGVRGDFPLWAFLLFVVGIDVAHVWSTVWRVYFDGEELRRRSALYLGVPIAVYALGVAAYQSSALTFWRLFAYAAVFHFIRQQYGWMALYGRRSGAGTWDRRLDAAAIYACTVAPVLWWHANLPRPFWWFVENDFAALPPWVGSLALAAHWLILAAWFGRQVQRWVSGGGLALGKLLLVAATWTAWYGGIVLAQSDYAFTVMNVVLHGVPYFALLYRYAKGRWAEEGGRGYGRLGHLLRAGVPGFFVVLLAFAFAEELLWDRLVWHDHAPLFGATGFELHATWLGLLVPLLALPQATHYALDAFIWKAGEDPALRARLGWGAAPPGDPGSPARTATATPTEPFAVPRVMENTPRPTAWTPPGAKH